MPHDSNFLRANSTSRIGMLYLNLKSARYRGDNFYCPWCDKSFGKFLPAGLNNRQNAQCPRCGSAERHRLLWLYLERKTNFFSKQMRALDIAPMPFAVRRFGALPNLSYITADLDLPWCTLNMDLTEIPVRDDSFDAIICYHVLEHIPDDSKAMRELHRILKPGGWALLQSPVTPTLEKTMEDRAVTSPEERARLYGDADHVRLYGLDYKDRLKKAGFLVNVDDFVKKLDDSTVKRYSLLRDEDIYYCEKE